MSAAATNSVGTAVISGLIDVGDGGLGNGAGCCSDGDDAQAAAETASTSMVQIRRVFRAGAMRHPIGVGQHGLQAVTLTR